MARSRTRVLSTFSLATTFGFLALVALAHVVVPSLDPVHHVVSEYAAGHGAGHVIGTAALVLWSASLFALAALARALEEGPLVTGRRQIVVVGLILAGVGIALASVFPTQAVRGRVPSGTDLTLAGRLHDMGAGAAQVALWVAAILSLPDLPTARLRRIAAATIATAVVLSATMGIGDADLGLRQRALILAACGWQVTMASGVRGSEVRSSRPGRPHM